MAKAKKTKENNAGSVIGMLGVAAAAVAGAYFLYGTKDGKKIKKQIRGWALKAKGEVLEKVEKLKEVNEDAYNQVVDTVLSRYKKIKGVDVVELAQIAQELKGHWSNIRKELEASAKKVSKVKSVAAKVKKHATE